MAGDIAVCALLILFCLFCLFNLMFGMGNVMDYDRICVFHAAVCFLLYDAAGEPQLEDAAFDRSSVHGRAVHPVFAVFAGAASQGIRNVPGSVAVL